MMPPDVRRSGDVDIDGDRLVHAAKHIIALTEDAAAACAGPDGDHHLRLRHLFIDLADDRQVLCVHAAGDKENIGVLRVAGIDDAEALHVIERCQARKHLDITAVADDPS